MTTAVEAARAYIARGWNPVPIPFKSKKPNGDGWQERVIGEADVQKYFKGKEQNVGVVLGPSSNDLTDLDLDCSEAIALASHALPRTSAMFGRASAPASHWLYQTKLASTSSEQKAVFVFNDPMRPKDDARLLEVRVGGFKGAQTVFPGSVHESGEEIRWDEDGAAAIVDGDDLLTRARRLASLCLLTRYWPGNGARHDAALSLGGFLARCGLKPAQIKYMVEAIARNAGDNEPKDRRDTAEDAAQEFQAGRPARGFPLLRKTFGEKIAEQIADWLDYRGSRKINGTGNSTGNERGSNSDNRLRLYAEVAEELLRTMSARDEDLQMVTDGAGNEHFWKYRGGLWSLLPKPAPWLENKIELTLREMKLRSASSAKFILEARKYIERSPNVRTDDRIVWDDHGKIPTRSGLIDPVTLTVEPFTKEHYATWALDVDYDPAATCPLWLELLDDYFPDQSAEERGKRVTLLQEYTGTMLLDRLPKALKRGLVVLGASDTGKSVLLRILSGLLTDSPISTPLSEVVGPHGLQEFMRRAPWVLDEAFDIGVWHLSSKVKAIIAREPLGINPKNAPMITMRINAPCLFGTNHPPTFKENTSAMTNRLLIVTLRRVFEKGNYIGVAAKARAINPAWEPFDLILDQERPGLLNWALAGLQRVLKRGNFIDTDEGLAALTEMKLEANPVAGFVRSCIDFDKTSMMTTVDFYAAFTGWREENHGDGKASFSPSFVGKNLRALSHPKIAQDKDVFKNEWGTRYYVGIKLNNEGRAHFNTARIIQNVKPQTALQRMSETASETNRATKEEWLSHPEVVKMPKGPAGDDPHKTKNSAPRF